MRKQKADICKQKAELKLNKIKLILWLQNTYYLTYSALTYCATNVFKMSFFTFVKNT